VLLEQHEGQVASNAVGQSAQERRMVLPVPLRNPHLLDIAVRATQPMGVVGAHMQVQVQVKVQMGGKVRMIYSTLHDSVVVD